MLIQYAEGQQRSGRLGATIASRNRYGSYYRAGTVPVNPSTDRQAAIRGALQALSIAWVTTLTQDQRDAWDLYGGNVSWLNRLGASVSLTGLSHYIRSNASRLQAGLTRIDDAPTTYALAPPEQALIMSASEATQQLTCNFDDGAAWCDLDDAAQLLYVGRPVNPGVKYFGGPYRLLAVIEGDSVSAPTSPEAALDTPDWPFVAGQRLWVRTRITLPDGRLSEFAQTNFLAAA